MKNKKTKKYLGVYLLGGFLLLLHIALVFFVNMHALNVIFAIVKWKAYVGICASAFVCCILLNYYFRIVLMQDEIMKMDQEANKFWRDRETNAKLLRYKRQWYAD